MHIVNKKLKNRVAIITGSTSGMGAAIAMLFASHGAKVVVNGRTKDTGKGIEQTILKRDGQAIFVQSDISSQAGNDLLVETALSHFGGIDIVVCNAGMLGLGSITKTTPELWHKTINTNLHSIYYLLRHAIPAMQKRGKGNILVNASIAAFKAFPNHAAYCASKGALVPLVKQIALEYAPSIRANLLCPGPVDTPLIWSSARAFANPGKAVAEAAEATLVGRLGDPAEIAKAALFLASDDSSYITGTSLTVDGGITAK